MELSARYWINGIKLKIQSRRKETGNAVVSAKKTNKILWPFSRPLHKRLKSTGRTKNNAIFQVSVGRKVLSDGQLTNVTIRPFGCRTSVVQNRSEINESKNKMKNTKKLNCTSVYYMRHLFWIVLIHLIDSFDWFIWLELLLQLCKFENVTDAAFQIQNPAVLEIYGMGDSNDVLSWDRKNVVGGIFCWRIFIRCFMRCFQFFCENRFLNVMST